MSFKQNEMVNNGRIVQSYKNVLGFPNYTIDYSVVYTKKKDENEN